MNIISYVLSQVFTIVSYVFFGLTYHCKERKKILVLSFSSLVANGIALFFLQGWTGIAMCVVSVVRNIIFFVDYIKNGKRTQNTRKDYVILISIYVITIIFTIITFDEVFSLLCVFSSMLFTYAIWQKNTKLYKLLGIPVSVLYVLYNIYLNSIFGVILECCMLISSISGYIMVTKKVNKEVNKAVALSENESKIENKSKV